MVYFLANSVDPDEMRHICRVSSGLYYLPKYLFTGIQNEKS